MRLVEGKTPHEGIVQLCVSSTWTYVGLDLWDELDAEVVCRNMANGNKKCKLASIYQFIKLFPSFQC